MANIRALFEALQKVDSNNAQGEFYLTDVLAICRGEGRKVLALATADSSECLGVNTPEQLAESSVEYISGLSVAAIDPEAHTVVLSDGRTLGFDKCIYALGMDCFVPPIEGKNAKNVFTLRGEGDLDSIRKANMMTHDGEVTY